MEKNLMLQSIINKTFYLYIMNNHNKKTLSRKIMKGGALCKFCGENVSMTLRPHMLWCPNKNNIGKKLWKLNKAKDKFQSKFIDNKYSKTSKYRGLRGRDKETKQIKARHFYIEHYIDVVRYHKEINKNFSIPELNEIVCTYYQNHQKLKDIVKKLCKNNNNLHKSVEIELNKSVEINKNTKKTKRKLKSKHSNSSSKSNIGNSTEISRESPKLKSRRTPKRVRSILRKKNTPVQPKSKKTRIQLVNKPIIKEFKKNSPKTVPNDNVSNRYVPEPDTVSNMYVPIPEHNTVSNSTSQQNSFWIKKGKKFINAISRFKKQGEESLISLQNNQGNSSLKLQNYSELFGNDIKLSSQSRNDSNQESSTPQSRKSRSTSQSRKSRSTSQSRKSRSTPQSRKSRSTSQSRNYSNQESSTSQSRKPHKQTPRQNRSSSSNTSSNIAKSQSRKSHKQTRKISHQSRSSSSNTYSNVAKSQTPHQSRSSNSQSSTSSVS